jgi:hypothetical protein
VAVADANRPPKSAQKTAGRRQQASSPQSYHGAAQIRPSNSEQISVAGWGTEPAALARSIFERERRARTGRRSPSRRRRRAAGRPPSRPSPRRVRGEARRRARWPCGAAGSLSLSLSLSSLIGELGAASSLLLLAWPRGGGGGHWWGGHCRCRPLCTGHHRAAFFLFRSSRLTVTVPSPAVGCRKQAVAFPVSRCSSGRGE